MATATKKEHKSVRPERGGQATLVDLVDLSLGARNVPEHLAGLEVANAILALSGDGTEFINGDIISVDEFGDFGGAFVDAVEMGFAVREEVARPEHGAVGRSAPVLTKIDDQRMGL